MGRKASSRDKRARELRKLAVSLVLILLALGLWQSGILESYLTQMFTAAINSAQP